MSSASSWLLQNSGLVTFAGSILVSVVFLLVGALCWGRSSSTLSALTGCRRASSTTIMPQGMAVLPAYAYAPSEGIAIKNDECAICLALMAEGEMVKKLAKCMHAFHAECIDVWLSLHSTCPLCRTDAKVTVTGGAAEQVLDVMGEESTGESIILPPLPPV